MKIDKDEGKKDQGGSRKRFICKFLRVAHPGSKIPGTGSRFQNDLAPYSAEIAYRVWPLGPTNQVSCRQFGTCLESKKNAEIAASLG